MATYNLANVVGPVFLTTGTSNMFTLARASSLFGLQLMLGQKDSPPLRQRSVSRTHAGVRGQIYNRDFFLGMPYAQPPVRDLRSNAPQPLDESWSGTDDAKEYSEFVSDMESVSHQIIQEHC